MPYKNSHVDQLQMKVRLLNSTFLFVSPISCLISCLRFEMIFACLSNLEVSNSLYHSFIRFLRVNRGDSILTVFSDYFLLVLISEFIIDTLLYLQNFILDYLLFNFYFKVKFQNFKIFIFVSLRSLNQKGPNKFIRNSRRIVEL